MASASPQDGTYAVRTGPNPVAALDLGTGQGYSDGSTHQPVSTQTQSQIPINPSNTNVLDGPNAIDTFIPLIFEGHGIFMGDNEPENSLGGETFTNHDNNQSPIDDDSEVETMNLGFGTDEVNYFDTDVDSTFQENDSQISEDEHPAQAQALIPLFYDEEEEASGSISTEMDESEPLDPSYRLFDDFPLLQFSETDVRFLRRPFSSPSLIFRQPLLEDSIHSLRLWDRFNMVQQIPELGVVVAASQKGRVGIFTLTEVPDTGMFFRLDNIVPFKSQESKGDRPRRPLLGIAVGPVERHLLPTGDSKPLYQTVKFEPPMRKETEFDNTTCGQHQSAQKHKDRSSSPSPRSPAGPSPRQDQWRGLEYSRRYRLLLMYSDHTILHYELFYDWPTEILGSRGKLVLKSD